MRNFTIFKIVYVVIFSLTITTQAQTINPPNLDFTRACASESFNTYNVTFSFAPASPFGAANQFTILLSDETGDFTNPVTLPANIEELNASSARISFSLPTTTAGEAYKLRVRSSDPVFTSGSSSAFSAYYKIQDTPFSINNLISTGTYCAGGSYLLTIDSRVDATNDSPLQYESLTFNWYKDTSLTTSVFVASGETLLVNEPGTYFVETNYGTCTSDSVSNKVTISEVGAGGASQINSSLGNPYCSANGPTILTTTAGDSYQWFKDGEEIEGATSQMYETNEAGDYTVNIDLGTCSTNASITLENGSFISTIDVDDVNNLDEGESLIATVTTDAVNPQFQWFLNETLIPSAVSNSYTATETGSYKVIITQTSGCGATDELFFTLAEPFPDVPDIPNLISPNSDGTNDTWIIPKQYVSGTNTEVLIISAQGDIVLRTKDYQNNWPENSINFKAVNPVYYYIITTEDNKTRKGSITVIK